MLTGRRELVLAKENHANRPAGDHGTHVHRQRTSRLHSYHPCTDVRSANDPDPSLSVPTPKSPTDSQAPYLFSTVWSLVKPWLDEATVRKIHILGKNYKSELTQYIDPANLPTELGGTCKCVGGCSLSDAGPWNKGVQRA